MAYNPNQPRQAGGKFGSSGVTSLMSQPGYVPISPQVMAQAQAQIAAATAKSAAATKLSKTLTPGQKAYLKQLTTAEGIEKKDVGKAKASAKKATAAKTKAAKAAAAAKARNPAALRRGEAAGKRTPARGKITAKAPKVKQVSHTSQETALRTLLATAMVRP